MFQECLDNHPHYNALSYRWNRNATQTIIIDGRPFPVMRNLEAALRRLRLTYEKQILWVDYICINQDNTAEQNHQVGLMRDIFRTASEVFIWLGVEKDREQWTREISEWQTTLFEGIRAVYSAYRTKERRGRLLEHIWRPNDMNSESSRSSESEPKRIERFQLYILETAQRPADYVLDALCFIQCLAENTHSHLYNDPGVRLYLYQRRVIRALKVIMECAWWDRIWVVQETILPPKATVIFGSAVAPWLMFVEAAINYDRHAHGCCSRVLRTLSKQQLDVLSLFSRKVIDLFEVRTALRTRLMGNQKALSASDMWNAVPTAVPRRTLISLIWAFRSRKATNARDKVYALIGLVTEWENCPALRPDYSLNPMRVYLTTVYNILKGTRSLEPLMGYLGKKPHGYLPSWVPDWSNGNGSYELERLHYARLFNASGLTLAETSLHEESVLALRGFRASCVAIVNAYPLKRDRPWWEAYAILSSWQADAHKYSFTAWGARRFGVRAVQPVITRLGEERVSRVEPTILEARDTVIDAFWRTLCGDVLCDFTNGKGYRRVSAADRNTYRKWTKHAHQIAYGRGGHPVAIFRDASPLTSHSAGGEVNKMDHAIRAATIERVFFTTADGRVGLGPPSIAEGDEVYILFGGRTPFVLRPSHQRFEVDGEPSECYELVGDCYVHGIMDGETITSQSLHETGWIYLR